MTQKWFRSLFVGVAASSLTAGCVNSHHAAMREPVVVQAPTRTIIVTEAPPAPQVETVGTPPDEAHVWLPGYWTRVDSRWVWLPGHWEVRPRAGATWVPGQWNRSADGRGWVWVPGHWE